MMKRQIEQYYKNKKYEEITKCLSDKLNFLTTFNKLDDFSVEDIKQTLLKAISDMDESIYRLAVFRLDYYIKKYKKAFAKKYMMSYIYNLLLSMMGNKVISKSLRGESLRRSVSREVRRAEWLSEKQNNRWDT